jgi:hypothetical protein
MTFSGKILLGVLVANAAVILMWLYNSITNDPELANKPEWSVLQAVEIQYRDKSSPDLVIERIGKYEMIGVKSLNGPSKVWILADPQFSPKVKIMPPNSKIRISSGDFEKIKNSTKLNEETELFLKNSTDN